MKKTKPQLTPKDYEKYPLVTIHALVYADGAVRYDLEYDSPSGFHTSDGLYTEIEVLAVLMAKMGVIKPPRLFIPPYQPDRE